MRRDVAVTLLHIIPVFFLLQQNDFIATIPGLVSDKVLKKLGLVMQPLPLKTPQREAYTVWGREAHSDPGLTWLREIIADAAVKVACV